nr:MAG TPA: Cyclin-dependent kinase 9 [Caudoviricetes sp.]
MLLRYSEIFPSNTKIFPKPIKTTSKVNLLS